MTEKISHADHRIENSKAYSLLEPSLALLLGKTVRCADPRLASPPASDSCAWSSEAAEKVHAENLAMYDDEARSTFVGWKRTPIPGSYLRPKSMCSVNVDHESMQSAMHKLRAELTLNAETKVASFREVSLFQLVLLDFEASLQDFLCLWSSNGDMDSNLFVTTDT